MNTMLGKSAGIALLLAALIALLATGVFSPGGALGQEDDEDEVPAHQINLDDMGAKFAIHYGASTGLAELELSPAFSPGRLSYDALYDRSHDDVDDDGRILLAVRAGDENTTTNVSLMSVDGAQFTDDADSATSSRIRHTISPDPEDEDASEEVIGAVIKVEVEAADGEISVYTVRVVQKGAIVNTTEAGAAARVTVTANLIANVSDSIVLGMKSFVLPDEINTNHILIDDGENSANPRDVTVGDGKITMTLGKLDSELPNSDAANKLGDSDAGTGEDVTIIIQSRAGVKTPTKAGNYTVTINSEDGNDSEAVDAKRFLSIIRSIKINPTSAGKGTSVTVTGRGFSNGSITVFRDLGDLDVFLSGTDEVLGQANVTKGAFTFQTTALDENSTIQAIDINGDVAEDGKSFTLKESIKVTPTEVFPDEELTIELVDWGDTGTVSEVRFGGASGTTLPATGSRSASGDKFTIDVPTSVRLGSLKVEVMVDGTAEASATITVQVQTLTLSPTTAVQGQDITITGSGFGANERIGTLTFGGGDNVYEGDATNSLPRADSNGNVTITAEVPDGVTSGEREVKITGLTNNRSGTAKLTVPKAAMTVSPSESLRGTMITVTGTGFPAEDLIQIKYEAEDGTHRPVTTEDTDTTGNFTVQIEVPSYAAIGATQKVTADAQLNEVVADVTADHSTPDPEMTLSPAKASPGQRITISGMSFAGFAPVAMLEIHDRDVKPVPTPATVANGSISMSGILVPQLDPGRYIVTLVVSGKTVTRFLEVTDEPASTDPADVFEPLTTNNNLTVVWHYDNDTKRWSSYSPTAPAALNDLAMVEPGMVVWVQVSGAVQFQGATLNEGWQLIVLK